MRTIDSLQFTPFRGDVSVPDAVRPLGIRVAKYIPDVPAGDDILFIHGSGPGATAESNFGDNLDGFLTRGFRCHLITMIGYDGSAHDGLRGYPEDRNLFDDQVTAVARYIETELPQRQVAIVGNSMGGAVAMQVAINYPQLVSKLVLMAPGGLADKDAYMTMLGIQAVIDELFKTGTHTVSLRGMRTILELMLPDSYREMITDVMVLQRTISANRTPIRRVMRATRVPNLSTLLDQITADTLVFWGEKDQFCPYDPDTLAAMEREIAGAVRIITLEDGGHWLQMQHAAYFEGEVFEFLTAT